MLQKPKPKDGPDWIVQNRDTIEKGVEIMEQAADSEVMSTVGLLHPGGGSLFEMTILMILIMFIQILSITQQQQSVLMIDLFKSNNMEAPHNPTNTTMFYCWQTSTYPGQFITGTGLNPLQSSELP